MPVERPEDLVTVEEAARMVGRSKSTVRAWVRTGELVGHREDPVHPENSRLLVSAAEARHRAEIVAGLPPAMLARNAEPPRPDPEAAALRAEVERLRAGVVEALQGRVDALEGRIADLVRAVETERLRGEEWRARALGAEAEREALRTEKGLPWWRRLLGAPAELPAATEDGPH
jgi:Helix-turn-helix domain